MRVHARALTRIYDAWGLVKWYHKRSLWSSYLRSVEIFFCIFFWEFVHVCVGDGCCLFESKKKYSRNLSYLYRELTRHKRKCLRKWQSNLTFARTKQSTPTDSTCRPFYLRAFPRYCRRQDTAPLFRSFWGTCSWVRRCCVSSSTCWAHLPEYLWCARNQLDFLHIVVLSQWVRTQSLRRHQKKGREGFQFIGSYLSREECVSPIRTNTMTVIE